MFAIPADADRPAADAATLERIAAEFIACPTALYAEEATTAHLVGVLPLLPTAVRAIADVELDRR